VGRGDASAYFPVVVEVAVDDHACPKEGVESEDRHRTVVVDTALDSRAVVVVANDVVGTWDDDDEGALLPTDRDNDLSLVRWQQRRRSCAVTILTRLLVFHSSYWAK
jgi:hypothetical protein